MRMEILNITDPEFRPYGKVLTGYPLMPLYKALEQTPLPEGVEYVPSDPGLEAQAEAEILRDHVFGGQEIQLGWCNGHNTKLNCLEYHRDSEVNLGTEDFILLLAKREEIVDGLLDTSCVRAFRCPAGIAVEVYATTLHYAPVSARRGQGFRVLVVLPKGTNLEKPDIIPLSEEDQMLWAQNKWLLAHPDSAEAAQGAYPGLGGKNPDLFEALQ